MCNRFLMCLLCLLALPLVAQAVETKLPLSSSELKSFGVYPATISGYRAGFLPETDDPYGDETPDYLVQYWEKGDTVVIAYGYGWGFLDHGFVFPMRKQPSDKCQHCYTLITGEGNEIGEGSCNYEGKVRKSCQLSFVGNNWLGNYTEVTIGFEAETSGTKLTARSFQTKVWGDDNEVFIFGDQDNRIDNVNTP